MEMPYKLLCIGIVSGLVAGCSTTGHFVVPEGSRLYLHERPEPVQVQTDGTVSTTPFFWTAVAGIRYRLEKDGMATKEGKLPAKFRVLCKLDLSGASVAVLDDVMTTGATLNELARALKRGGATRVENFVIARTVLR